MESKIAHETATEQEAIALKEMLEHEGITATLLKHGDRAYPGIVDRGKSGVEIRVIADQIDKAHTLIAEYLAAEPIEGPPEAPHPDSVQATVSSGGLSRILSVLFLLLVLGFVIYLLRWS